jgi:dihydrodipicolinate synthase/N-acetylneuraminate lyase
MSHEGLMIMCMSLTPFQEDGSLDEEQLRIHLRRLVAARNAICLGSSGSGEGTALTVKELRRVYEIGVEEAKGKVPVWANPREAYSAAEMYEVAKEAVAAGVDAVSLYQLKGGHGMIPNEREQQAYFEDLLDVIDCPVAIEITTSQGYYATVPFVTQLCKRYEQICAIAVMGTPHNYFVALRDVLPDSIALHTSPLDFVHRLALGARAVWMPWNNVIPNIAQSIADGFAAGDLPKVCKATLTYQRFSRIMDPWYPKTPRGLKMAMKVLGLGNGVLRRPYLLPPEEDLRIMERAFGELHIRELEGLTIN